MSTQQLRICTTIALASSHRPLNTREVCILTVQQAAGTLKQQDTRQPLPGSVFHCSKMLFMKAALAALGSSVHTLSSKSHNACQLTHVDMHTCGEIMYSSDAVTIGLLITHEMKTRPMIRYVAVQCFLLPCNQACSSRASARSQCTRHSPLRSVAFQ